MMHAIVALALAAAGSQTDAPYADCSLRLQDLPRSAPQFSDYPARKLDGVATAAPKLATPMARMFRIQLRRQAAAGPNFGGSGVLAAWGCGTGCVSFAVIDARTGDVAFPPEMNVVVQSSASPLDRLIYRPDSRLLIVTGAPDEDFSRLGVRFYVWSGSALKLLKSYSYADVCPPAAN